MLWNQYHNKICTAVLRPLNIRNDISPSIGVALCFMPTGGLCIHQMKHCIPNKRTYAAHTSERSSHRWVCYWYCLYWRHLANNVTFGTHIWWAFSIVFVWFLIKWSPLMCGLEPTAILWWHLFPVLVNSIELNYSKQMFHPMWIASENSLVWTIVWALLQNWNHISKWACGLPI